MQLTQFTDFSLRVLMYLTYKHREDLVTITEIAEQFSIPRNHLIKVVNNLVKQGWVNATRGRNGGLALAIAPAKLTLGKLIQQLENHDYLIDCNKTQCRLTGQCELQNVLGNAQQMFYQFLDQYTLADIVKDPTQAMIINMHKDWKLAS